MTCRIVFIALMAIASVAVGGVERVPGSRSPVLPVSFEANHGQVDPEVKYLARLAKYRLYLTSTEAVVTAPDSAPMRMRVVGMRRNAIVEGEDTLPGKAHYLLGKREQWRTDVPTFGRVRYHDAYPGIDLVYYGTDRKLEYDFLVDAGADPAQIELEFSGLTSLTLEPSGELTLITSSTATFTLEKPRLYQVVNGVEREIEGGYRRVGPDRIRFRVGEYDKQLPLVIDPVLEYSTYLGTSSRDKVTSLALDPQGNIVLLGETESTTFPVTPDAFQSSPADVVVTKLNAAGTAIVYSTYFGGSASEFANDIAVDSTGNIYIGGYTYSSDLPIANAVQPTYVQVVCNNEFGGICPDAFATKLNASGSALVFSTYLGGHGFDSGYSVAVDAAGSLYLTGSTDSFDFPTLNPLFPRFAIAFSPDAFLTKFDAAGALVYSTYLGGSGSDRGFDVAVDASQNVYVVGDTTSSNFPVVNPIQATNVNFGEDAFITKINAAGTGAIYSTYLGGNQRDSGYGIAVDAGGNAYVAGVTRSTNFPTVAPIQPVLRGENDLFVAKLSSAGSALLYSTYLGGNDREEQRQQLFDFVPPQPVKIAVSGSGETYLSGHTSSSDFPSSTPFGGGVCSTFPFPIPFPIGETYTCPDAFLTLLDPQGTRIRFSTLLGGDQDDRSRVVVVGPDGSIYIGGQTQSNSFPTIAPLQAAYAGNTDGFIARFDPDRPACTLPAPTGLSYQFFARTGPFRPVFSWEAVPGAETYVVVMTPMSELVLTGNPSSQVIAVVDERPSIGTPTLPAGDYAVVVVPTSAACGAGTPSQPVRLTMPQNCPLAEPLLISPGGVVDDGPVHFRWTASPGASLYQLIRYVAATGRFVSQHISATNEFILDSTPTGGEYLWFVSAWNSSCGPTTSGPGVYRF